MIRVLLAEDEVVVRQGIRRILEGDPAIEIVGEVGDEKTAVEEAGRLKPDVAVVAAGLPEAGGIAAAERIKRVADETRLLILAWEAEESEVRRNMAKGRYHCLPKACSDQELVNAVKELVYGSKASNGGALPGIGTQGASETSQKEASSLSLDLLTAREREVLVLISQGKTNREIGECLRISANTADSHRKHIMEKLGVHSKTELIRFAVVKGLIR